ncbi:MAG: Type 1 glutamine amidotransferase-like domain-containing protein [Clostridiales bacterium]|jgi:dipeptidase E|nr:Type 1 glutamine amidotransferase-like domain-containing protein [Clostridiales bacterium]
MKKLFLSSYFAGAAKLFPYFAGGCSGKKAVFIPTASLREKMTFFVGADLKALRKLGLIVNELEVSSASRDEIADKISNADYVFVAGGNTFFLLQELRRSGADKLIAEHINSGKPYIGSSAGSVVVSRNIEYLKYMDEPAAAPDLNGDFAGLSVVDFCIVPHCANFPFKKPAAKIISEYSDMLDLRPISNNQAVTVDSGNVEIVTAESCKPPRKTNSQP